MNDETWKLQIRDELHEQFKDKLEPWAIDLRPLFEVVATEIEKAREDMKRECLEALPELDARKLLRHDGKIYREAWNDYRTEAIKALESISVTKS